MITPCYSIKNEKDCITQEKILNFLKESDNQFEPPLSEFVQIDLYAKKIFEKAELFYVLYDQTIVALIACYLNDFTEGNGFITFVSVSKKHQKKGLAKRLLSKAIEFAKTRNFKNITLEVNIFNSHSIKLYETFGFVKDKSLRGNYLKMKLLL